MPYCIILGRRSGKEIWFCRLVGSGVVGAWDIRIPFYTVSPGSLNWVACLFFRFLSHGSFYLAFFCSVLLRSAWRYRWASFRERDISSTFVHII